MKNKIESSLCQRLLLCSCLLVPTLVQAESNTRQIDYYEDMSVTVTNNVQRVATSWESQNSIITMLGFGERIVATTRFARLSPAFRKFVPGIAEVPLSTNGGQAGVDVERMLALRPDIIFVGMGLPQSKKEQLERSGIAVATFRSGGMEKMLERVGLIGKMLGDEADAEAQRYLAYFEKNRLRVAERIASIPEADRIKVYVASGTPLATTGRPSLNQDWLDLAGGINVAEDWHLTVKSETTSIASIESIIGSNPDVIISMRARDVDVINSDPRWSNINAVKNGRVYANPRGIFWWCRESSEEALQMLWVAKLLYPDLFSDIDMRKEAFEFYREFYDIELTDEDLDGFLNPAPMAVRSRT
ncbi:ABC transporter substrate-binding protein [Shewanella youngdeokensis]|uniref:ABC transporter substrate-binding protein n=1 Tax=Shewanella youngdeokensis TaxID=2999068 RepID=A0ABZ0K288_9GAMM|nr:ABC transporter substrate-binding protein [Shewanella sp. DAU334]